MQLISPRLLSLNHLDFHDWVHLPRRRAPGMMNSVTPDPIRNLARSCEAGRDLSATTVAVNLRSK
jgi:hypothetical protein